MCEYIVFQNNDMEDPFYDTISTVEECYDAEATTVHFPKKEIQEPHITYLTAPEIKKEKKHRPAYYTYIPGSNKISSIKSPTFSGSPSKQQWAEEDDFFVFGKHVANELRAVEDAFALQTMKMKINTILFEGRTGQYNRISPQSILPHDDRQDSSSVQHHNQTGDNPEESASYQLVTCPSMPSIS